MENNNVLPDTSKPAEEKPLEKQERSEATEDLSKKLQDLEERNSKIYARLKKAEEDRTLLKEKLTAFESDSLGEDFDKRIKKESEDDGLSIMEVLNLKKQGYSDEEILDLSTEASKLGVPVSKVLSNDFFKLGVEAKRAKAKAEQAIPASSSRSINVNNKSWDQMTPAERQTNIDQVWKQALGGSKSSRYQ